MNLSNESKSRRIVLDRRTRFAQTTLAALALGVAAIWGGINPIDQWWFWGGATAALASAVIYPYYTGPFGALPYGLAAVGAYFTAPRTHVELVWSVYLCLAVLVCVSAAIAMTLEDGRIREMARWLSARLGRPLILGYGAVAIENLRIAAVESAEIGAKLTIGTFVAVSLTVPDWYRFWGTASTASKAISTVETAIDPNLLLMSSPRRFKRGAEVQVKGKETASGVVVSNLAHKHGNRIQVVLDRPWDKVADSAGYRCLVDHNANEGDSPVAFAAEGSTDRCLRLHPFGGLKYGDAVRWECNGRTFMYQVTDLQLERIHWDGSVVIEERASASQLGSVAEGESLVPEPSLPAPYQPVWSAKDYTVSLPAGYERIGVIAGTAIELGVSCDALSSHHLAVLGMSGMGKSTISRRLVDLMSKESIVVAMDGTGEYRTRFAFDELDRSRPPSGPGLWVYEPAGKPTLKAMEYVEQLMSTAHSEYKCGRPHRRTLLFEEAHAFLPEWNFTADRGESEHVSKTCRFILQARKFGLTFIFVSQRTAVISKSALSQCESYIIFRTLGKTSLEYLEGLVGAEVKAAIPSLSRFQAVCVGPAFSATSPVIVNLDPIGTVESGEDECLLET